MLSYKKLYYDSIDKMAKKIADNFVAGSFISEEILKFINELYLSAKVEQSFKSSLFETAYHTPISSELEFYIARIFLPSFRIKKKRLEDLT